MPRRAKTRATRAVDDDRQPLSRAERASRTEVRRGLTELRPMLYARALRLTRSPSTADDVVQETMLRALRFETQYRAGTNLKAWLGQVLMSVFLTGCRRSKRERRAMDHIRHEPDRCTPSTHPVMMHSLSRRTSQALGALPEGYRTAVQLVDLQSLSYRDAAMHLGIPVGTIMSRLHRGRKILAQALREPRCSSAEVDSALAA